MIPPGLSIRIDSEKIAQAIIDARWRGVKVRVFIEHDYVFDKDPPKDLADPIDPETNEEAMQRAKWVEHRDPEDIKTNRDIHMALLRNGVDIKADYNHNKIFRDNLSDSHRSLK